jgi:hypothetical protein
MFLFFTKRKASKVVITLEGFCPAACGWPANVSSGPMGKLLEYSQLLGDQQQVHNTRAQPARECRVIF